MIRHLAVFGAATALGLSICPACAQDPLATFYSESVLKGALENIAEMPETELRKLTHYLAECTDDENMTETRSKHTCTVAEQEYEIEFGRNRPLDKIIISRGLLPNATQAELMAKSTRQIVDDAAKYVKVMDALFIAAQNRFGTFRSSIK